MCFLSLLGTICDGLGAEIEIKMDPELKQKCVKNGIGEHFCVRPRFYIVFYCFSHPLVARKPLKSIVKQEGSATSPFLSANIYDIKKTTKIIPKIL